MYTTEYDRVFYMTDGESCIVFRWSEVQYLELDPDNCVVLCLKGRSPIVYSGERAMKAFVDILSELGLKLKRAEVDSE
jgi:hypothetical protein